MLKTNEDRLPVILVQGEVSHPRSAKPRMTVDGTTSLLVGTGGIVYNCKIGDPACGWAADHLEPGATTRNRDEGSNSAYHMYSCIGNTATVVSGEARGAQGIVTGKHGGVDHVLVYFAPEDLERMSIGDRINIRACGLGLELPDYPEVKLRSLSPDLLHKMNLTEQDGALRVPVACIVPPEAMGAGLGSGHAAEGDYDISMFDEAFNRKHGLDKLRLGDIVAVLGSDTRYGRTFRGGYTTIGVVVHSDSKSAGHGPGVTTLLCGPSAQLAPVLDKHANLADYYL